PNCTVPGEFLIYPIIIHLPIHGILQIQHYQNLFFHAIAPFLALIFTARLLSNQ
ncbi:MAG: hypothetical protein ACI9LL_000443, partial [Porticoccus sp.]